MRLTSRQSISPWRVTRRVLRHRSEQQATHRGSRRHRRSTVCAAVPTHHTHTHSNLETSRDLEIRFFTISLLAAGRREITSSIFSRLRHVITSRRRTIRSSSIRRSKALITLFPTPYQRHSNSRLTKHRSSAKLGQKRPGRRGSTPSPAKRYIYIYMSLAFDVMKQTKGGHGISLSGP